ncbi:MAG: hypothetical protein Q9183_000330 [Haloplaca sp. 2 TL-2023]
MASESAFDTNLVDQRVKTLVNAQLKTVLKREKLAVSGLKAAMQDRIIQQLHHHAANKDLVRLNRLKGFINNPDASHSPVPSITSHHPSHPHARQSAPLPLMAPGTSIPLKVREATRDQIETKITFRSDVAEMLTSDTNIRVLLFCASEPITHYTTTDIAFPHQVEVKVNMDEVKANFRGLKNKPGSTRPADITSLLRKRANYENSLSLTYALTQKRFYFVVNLVKRHNVEDLVAKLKSGKVISKDQVIREMISKAHDSDVQATGANMSLKCPLSTLRIEVPCRSTICTHNQCFDASSFLQLQEQAPTWTCPVCNKIVSFEALEVDQYVDNILKSTPRSVDLVTVEPDGKWSQITDGDELPSGDHDSSDDDDADLVEIRDPPRVAAVKHEMNGAGLMRTPPVSSREHSSSSVPPQSVGSKRSASAIIDLISDDEDEEIRRPPKRPSIAAYPTPSDKSRPQPERGISGLFGRYPPRQMDQHTPRGYPNPP